MSHHFVALQCRLCLVLYSTLCVPGTVRQNNPPKLVRPEFFRGEKLHTWGVVPVYILYTVLMGTILT